MFSWISQLALGLPWAPNKARCCRRHVTPSLAVHHFPPSPRHFPLPRPCHFPPSPSFPPSQRHFPILLLIFLSFSLSSSSCRPPSCRCRVLLLLRGAAVILSFWFRGVVMVQGVASGCRFGFGVSFEFRDVISSWQQCSRCQ